LIAQKKLMDQIVDIYELAAILKASHHTLKKNWREFPHFFIGDGCNLKGARFEVSEVVKHLKKKARYVSVERSTIQKRGFQNKVESAGMGSSEARGAKKSTEGGTDPFNLLSGIDKVS
jgi:hypothetical protein